MTKPTPDEVEATIAKLRAKGFVTDATERAVRWMLSSDHEVIGPPFSNSPTDVLYIASTHPINRDHHYAIGTHQVWDWSWYSRCYYPEPGPWPEPGGVLYR